MKSSDLIVTNPEILGGKPVFKGTRVPVKRFFTEFCGWAVKDMEKGRDGNL
jgi:hypothetical protein